MKEEEETLGPVALYRKALSSLCDVFVNDALRASMWPHGTITTLRVCAADCSALPCAKRRCSHMPNCVAGSVSGVEPSRKLVLAGPKLGLEIGVFAKVCVDDPAN